MQSSGGFRLSEEVGTSGLTSYEIQYSELRDKAVANEQLQHFLATDLFLKGEGLSSFVRNCINSPDYLFEGQAFPKHKETPSIETLQEHIVSLLGCDKETAKHIIEAHSQTPSIAIPDIIVAAAGNVDLLAKQPRKALYYFYRDGDDIYLKCVASEFPIHTISSFGNPSDNPTHLIPGTVESLFKLTAREDKYGYTLISATCKDPKLASILEGEILSREELDAAYSLSPFGSYLNNIPVQKQLEENAPKAMDTTSIISGKGLTSRYFDNLPPYSGDRFLVDSFKQALDNSEMTAWIDAACALALNDLFDDLGNIRPDVYRALNQDNVLTTLEEGLTENYKEEGGRERAQQEIKSNLFGAYLQMISHHTMSEMVDIGNLSPGHPFLSFSEEINNRSEAMKHVDAETIHLANERLVDHANDLDMKSDDLQKGIADLVKIHCGKNINFVVEKKQWKDIFLQRLNTNLNDNKLLLEAFNARESIKKNDRKWVVRSVRELKKAFDAIDKGDQSVYSINDPGRLGNLLLSVGFSKEEIDSMRKSDILRYEAAIFTAKEEIAYSNAYCHKAYQSLFDKDSDPLAFNEDELNKNKNDQNEFLDKILLPYTKPIIADDIAKQALVPQPTKTSWKGMLAAAATGATMGALIGGGVGAAIGFALLPFTFGISLPIAGLVGVVVGGAVGGAITGGAFGLAIGYVANKFSSKPTVLVNKEVEKGPVPTLSKKSFPHPHHRYSSSLEKEEENKGEKEKGKEVEWRHSFNEIETRPLADSSRQFPSGQHQKLARSLQDEITPKSTASEATKIHSLKNSQG